MKTHCFFPQVLLVGKRLHEKKPTISGWALFEHEKGLPHKLFLSVYPAKRPVPRYSGNLP